jgi:hypothetical protein
VFVVEQVGDTALTRPWSKYSEGSSAHERVQKREEERSDGGERSSKARGGERKEKKIYTEEQRILLQVAPAQC